MNLVKEKIDKAAEEKVRSIAEQILTYVKYEFSVYVTNSGKLKLMDEVGNVTVSVERTGEGSYTANYSMENVSDETRDMFNDYIPNAKQKVMK
jgi:hypothetical protein